MVEDKAGFDPGRAPLLIKLQNSIEILGDVDDQGLADGLAALRCSATTRQHRNTLLGRDFYRRFDVVRSLWDKDTDRLNLVDRRICAVTAAAKRIEQDFSLSFVF